MSSVVDLFSGAGGFGLGFELAGFDVLTSLEIDKWAAETIKLNKDHRVVNDDIRNYHKISQISPILDDSPEIIIGGPPCQGFSLAGKREKDDLRNVLYREYLNWVKLLKPKIFVIENVTGILNFRNLEGTKIIEEIKEKFEGLGYNIDIWKLNSVDYGIPQYRKRVFIVGNRLGQMINPPIPTHSDKNNLLPGFVTVGDAILDLPKLLAGEGNEQMDYTFPSSNDFQNWSRFESEFVFNHVAMKHTTRIIRRFESIISNSEIEEESKVKKRNGNGELSQVNYSLNNRLLISNKPSFTIPAHFYSSFVHPIYPRNLTAREAARIQSFPDSYKFYGARTLMSSKLLKKIGREEDGKLSQYNQIGNAVPPLLAMRIAEHLRNFL